MGHATAWPYFYAHKKGETHMKYYRIVYRQGMGKVGAEISRVGSGVRYRKRKTQGNVLVLWGKVSK